MEEFGDFGGGFRKNDDVGFAGGEPFVGGMGGEIGVGLGDAVGTKKRSEFFAQRGHGETMRQLAEKTTEGQTTEARW